jgi:hypothetical protein
MIIYILNLLQQPPIPINYSNSQVTTQLLPL